MPEVFLIVASVLFGYFAEGIIVDGSKKVGAVLLVLSVLMLILLFVFLFIRFSTPI